MQTTFILCKLMANISSQFNGCSWLPSTCIKLVINKAFYKTLSIFTLEFQWTAMHYKFFSINKDDVIQSSVYFSQLQCFLYNMLLHNAVCFGMDVPIFRHVLLWVHHPQASLNSYSLCNEINNLSFSIGFKLKVKLTNLKLSVFKTLHTEEISGTSVSQHCCVRYEYPVYFMVSDQHVYTPYILTGKKM